MIPTFTTPAPSSNDIIRQSADAAEALIRELNVLLGEVDCSRKIAQRALAAEAKTGGSGPLPEAARFHDFYLQAIADIGDDALPSLSRTARLIYCEGFAAAIFGNKSVDKMRRKFGDNGEDSDQNEDSVQNTALTAFKIAKVFFDAPDGSAAQFLLIAAAVAAQRENGERQ